MLLAYVVGLISFRNTEGAILHTQFVYRLDYLLFSGEGWFLETVEIVSKERGVDAYSFGEFRDVDLFMSEKESLDS